MPLLRAMARTAVVAGTATAVSNRVSRRQAGRWASQEQSAPPEEYEEQEPVAAAPAPAEPAADPMEAKLAQLKSLGELKAQGVLTDAEFEAEKQKVLQG